jgi:hypothetical protein
MGNRIGVIFHENWNDFSPLMYSHYGENTIPFKLQQFIRTYYKENDINDKSSGHKYDPCHMMVGFLQFIDKDIHIRVENLSDKQIEELEKEHDYPNCFEGDCWIINISRNSFGETIHDIGYMLDNDNLLTDELKNEYDNY